MVFILYTCECSQIKLFSVCCSSPNLRVFMSYLDVAISVHTRV